MTSTPTRGRRGGPHARLRSERPWWLVAGVVVVGGLSLGALTSYAQGFLPDALVSFANSPSGWTILTVVLIGLLRPALVPAAVLGAVCFVCLVLGYTVASELSGLTYSPVFWGLTGLVAGPVVGAATSGLTGRRPVPSALGSAVVAAILLADAARGLTVVADSTSPVYWVLVAVLAVALLAVVARRSLRSPGLIALQLSAAVALLAIASGGYAVLDRLAGA